MKLENFNIGYHKLINSLEFVAAGDNSYSGYLMQNEETSNKPLLIDKKSFKSLKKEILIAII